MRINKPIVILTSDVHHQSDNIKEQRLYTEREIDLAVRYAEYIKEYNLKATFFMTGICFKKYEKEISRIINLNCIELGGHTYNCYKPSILYKVWGKIFKTGLGPKFIQKFDINNTVSALLEYNVKMKSWRNHSYRRDKYTYELLDNASIEFVSNTVGANEGIYKISNCKNLTNVGINVYPDHEHLAHGFVTKDNVGDRRFGNNKFNDVIYSKDEYFKKIFQQIDNNHKKNMISVMLLHPGCMKVMDDFELLNRILLKLKSYDCRYMSDVRIF